MGINTIFYNKLTNYNLLCGISPPLFVLKISQIKEKNHSLSIFIDKSSVNLRTGRINYAAAVHASIHDDISPPLFVLKISQIKENKTNHSLSIFIDKSSVNLRTGRINGETIEMTLSSRHRIRNSRPGGLRLSTLPLGHGGSPQ